MNTSINNITGVTDGNSSSSLIFIKSGPYLNKVTDGFFKAIYIPSFVYTIIMMLIGCPGNILVLYVYFSKWRKSTARVFIISLALFDLVNGFITTPTELAFMWNIFRWTDSITCKFSRFLTFMMNNASSFTLLGIAIDRYMQICRPLHPSMNTNHAKTVVFVSVFFAIVFAWPALVIYGIQTIPYPIPGTPYVVVGTTCLIEDYFTTTNWPLVFTIVLLVGNFAIDVALVVLYTLIAIQVIRRGSFDRDRDSSVRSKLRKGSTSTTTTDDGILEDGYSEHENKTQSSILRFTKKFHGSIKEANEKTADWKPGGKPYVSPAARRSQYRSQRSMSLQSEEARRVRMIKTTIMLFLVTLLFMVAFIPYCVIVVIRYVNPMYYLTLSTPAKAVYQFFIRSYLLSMSLNPVIYSFMSQQFREEGKNGLRKLICWKKFWFIYRLI